MKKNYVKPMMESEAFVANEYVAACWTRTCTSCGEVVECKHDNHVVGTQIIEGAFGNKTEGCTNEITNSTVDIELFDDNFWWLVGNLLFGSMSWKEAWEIYENGRPITISKYVHTVSTIKGHTHDDWNFPNASC